MGWLHAAYQYLIQREQPGESEAKRLLAIVDDLRWYAERIGTERWDKMPRSNTWSFEQNLWRLTRQAKKGEAPVSERLHYFIDCGKACVGLASEILSFFEYGELD